VCARCKSCDISYPPSVSNCQVCGEKLDRMMSQPDADWEERVREARRPDDESVVLWRLHEILRLGFPFEEAENLAYRRDVDVGRLRDIVRRGCPLDVALRIIA